MTVFLLPTCMQHLRNGLFKSKNLFESTVLVSTYCQSSIKYLATSVSESNSTASGAFYGEWQLFATLTIELNT